MPKKRLLVDEYSHVLNVLNYSSEALKDTQELSKLAQTKNGKKASTITEKAQEILVGWEKQLKRESLPRLESDRQAPRF